MVQAMVLSKAIVQTAPSSKSVHGSSRLPARVLQKSHASEMMPFMLLLFDCAALVAGRGLRAQGGLLPAQYLPQRMLSRRALVLAIANYYLTCE